MASVRASTRVSISWSGGEPFEDTDTLVLTIDGFSLDLRVFNNGPDAGAIDWATVAKVTEVEGSTPENPILRWDHILDSRPPTEMEDQGVFDTRPNGDVTETGTMFNPKNGTYEGYVETWHRYPSEPGSPYCVLERIEPVTSGSGSSRARAFVGRVGSRVLGLGITSSGEFLAVREDISEAGTKRIYDFGGDFPNIPYVMPPTCQAGAELELGGQRWKVHTAGAFA